MLVGGSWASLPLVWLVGCLAGDPAGYRRKVSLEYNPGSNSSSDNLLHVRAVGHNDTIHYVWSTIGAPTVLLVYTGSQNSTLHVNWTKLLSPSPSGAIHIEPASSVLYSSAVIFAKVFEYNGVNTSDLFKVPDDDFYPTYNLANFTWESLGGKINETMLTATFQGVSSSPHGAFGNGSISFQMAQLVSVPDNHSTMSSFFQWKTTAYSSQRPERADTIHCQYYPLQTTNCTVPRSSIAHAYFGEELESHHGVAAINISFGSEDSEAYDEKRYLSWSALVGFGEPPKDTFSTLVIAILAVGLGTPVVLLVAGSITALFTQKRRYSEYEPIN
ncbi:PREDICTED: glycosylated lysosomal membrane protein [Gekko japonicus]|uniref:Glycosylated lysosomal membrane protein n=1 Tax=Gekko japonicus TaxID=146911 RepID=A0ABM1JXV0_GEKJA|nr:PREDICTED: glycosylated lysosomal membrane protein [Gekko japonicus]